MGETRIVLADDHPVVREGLRGLLGTEPDLRVIGETDDGLKVVDLVERLKPDVLIVDIVMPGLNGVEITRQVNQRSPETRVLVMSVHTDDLYVQGALRNGAVGYVIKDASTNELLKAVHEVAAGRLYLSSPLSQRALKAYAREARKAPDMYESLTGREREVLHLLVEGYNNTEVGERLSISPRTVATHRTNFMRKLGLETKTDLIRFALRQGLIPLNDEKL